jgi:hypothetical protein
MKQPLIKIVNRLKIEEVISILASSSVSLEQASSILLEGNDKIQKTVSRHGIEFSIEWPTGSTRRYQGSDFSRLMKADYGFVRGAVSESDGDYIDVYLGNSPSDVVYVVTQLKHTDEYPEVGKEPERVFDEFKYMVDFTSRKDAEEVYKYHLTPSHFGGIYSISIHEFRQMIYDLVKGTKYSDVLSTNS